MPPSTRREVRLSASIPDPSGSGTPLGSMEPSRSGYFLVPNMEAILENFEQFKRKHISQNREVIKTNALAQQRIRELETRIQILEAEKLEQALATLPMKAQLSRLQYALSSIRSSWVIVGQELDSVSSGQGVQHPSRPLDSTMPSHTVSNRVTIEHNPNALNIVRSISKAPETHIPSLTEDDELCLADPSTPDQGCFGKIKDEQKGRVSCLDPPSDVKDYLTSVPSRASEFVLDIGGAPSPMGSPALPMDLGNAFVDASRSDQDAWLVAQRLPGSDKYGHFAESLIQAQENRSHTRRSGRKSGRRQSGLLMQTVNSSRQEDSTYPEGPANERQHLSPSSSYDDRSRRNPPRILSGLGHSATASGSPIRETALQDVTNSTAAVPAQDPMKSAARKSRRETIETSLKPEKACVENFSANASATPGGRKRKTPTLDSSEPVPVPSFTSSTSDASAEAYDADRDPQTGRTRRIRKSVNYALPKLNTKMRKPDPSELVPVTTPQRSALGTPVTGELQGSRTGHLSDIRQEHEASVSRMSPAERTSLLRRQGSPSRSVDRKRMYDEDTHEDGPGDQADLFEIKRRDLMHADAQRGLKTNARDVPRQLAGMMWNNAVLEHNSSDEDGAECQAVTAADLEELAQMEDALSELSTSDDDDQVLNPRVGPPSSSLSAQLLSSSSSDSLYTCPPTGHESAKRKIILNKKATTPAPKPTAQVQVSKKVLPISAVHVRHAANNAELKLARGALSQPSEGGPSSSGLAAGMKPRQRPSSAGPILSAARGPSTDHQHMGRIAENPAMPTASGSNVTSIGSETGSRSSVLGTNQRVPLHSVLTSQARPTQGTPRAGSKGFPTASTPFFKNTSRF